MGAIFGLEEILDKIRKICGIGNNRLDNRLKLFIDSAYNYELPSYLRSLQLEDFFVFETKRHIEIYPFDQTSFQVPSGEAYVSKKIVPVYMKSYWRYNSHQIALLSFGDGTAGEYIYRIENPPIVRSVNSSPEQAVNPNYPNRLVQNILITTDEINTKIVTDNGFGKLYEKINGTFPEVGNINYDTGEINITFSSPVESGAKIEIQFSAFKPSLPQSITFFQNQFSLDPIPDKGYTVEILCRRTPSQALLESEDVPELQEWWEFLAFSGAKKFFEENMDEEGINFCSKLLQEKLSIIESREYMRVAASKISTEISTSEGFY